MILATGKLYASDISVLRTLVGNDYEIYSGIDPGYCYRLIYGITLYNVSIDDIKTWYEKGYFPHFVRLYIYEDVILHPYKYIINIGTMYQNSIRKVYEYIEREDNLVAHPKYYFYLLKHLDAEVSGNTLYVNVPGWLYTDDKEQITMLNLITDGNLELRENNM